MNTPPQLTTEKRNDTTAVVARMPVIRYPDAVQFGPEEPDDLQSLVRYFAILWRHKWTLVLSLAGCVLIAIAVSLMMTPYYRAQTTVEIDRIEEPFGASIMNQDYNLTTQSELLASRTMRRRALDAILAREEPDRAETTEPLAFLRQQLGLPDPGDAVTWEEAVSLAAASLEVASTGESSILEIRSDSPNPRAAADFVNTLADEYIQYRQDTRWEAYDNTTDWLSRAGQDLKDRLEQSETALANLARSSGLVFTDDTTSVVEERLRQTQAELATASADRITREAVYDSSLSSPTEALPEVLDSGPMREYQVRLSELRREMALLSTTFTPAHYRVQQLQAQIDELGAGMESERSNIIRRIRIEYEAAVRREQELERQFESQSAALSAQADLMIQYNMLKREVETNNALYASTLQRGKEASVASAIRPDGARVVDDAQAARNPSRPNLGVNLALGLVGGLVFGSSLVIVRTKVDRRIRVPGTFDVSLDVRELGVIPSAGSDREARGLARQSRRNALKQKVPGGGVLFEGSNGQGKPPETLELVTWIRKASLLAESFRATMASILMTGHNGSRPKVIVVSSPMPREGKSAIVSNLAIALAEINQRVLIIDGDMRRPRLHTIFDVPNSFGLSDILHDRTPIDKESGDTYSRKTAIPGLYVLPAGPARTNLSSLLYSPKMQQLVDLFRGSFDMILIDSAPVLNVPDSRVLARSADGVVLVFRAHQTNQDAALQAAHALINDGTPILGTILNDWNPKTAQYGYSGYRTFQPYGDTRP